MDLSNAGLASKRKFHHMDNDLSSTEYGYPFVVATPAAATSFSGSRNSNHETGLGLPLDDTISAVSDTGSSLRRRWSRGTDSNSTVAGEESKEIRYLCRLSSMRDNDLVVKRCRSMLLRVPYETRQYLLELFRDHYNAYITLLPRASLLVFHSPDLDEHTPGSLFTYLATLAIGLLYATSQQPGVTALRNAGTRESLLHHELKSIIEEYVLQKCDTENIPILLLFSELERCIDRSGTARLYVREVARLLKLPQPSQLDLSVSDEEIINRRSYIRAYEFIRMQWALLDPPLVSHQENQLQEALKTQDFEHGKSQTGMPKRQAGTELYIYHAHLELLRLAEAVAQSLQRIPCGHVLTSFSTITEGMLLLSRWHDNLPNWMGWDSRNSHSFPGPFYLLHQQYFAILLVLSQRFEESNREPITTSLQRENLTHRLRGLRTRRRSNAAQLAVMITEYGEKFSFQNSPVVLAFHIELAANSLIASIAASDAVLSEDMVGNFASLNSLQSALKMMSSTYKRAEIILEEIKSHIDAMGISVPCTSGITSCSQKAALASEQDGYLIDWGEAGFSKISQDGSSLYPGTATKELEVAAPSFLELTPTPPDALFSRAPAIGSEPALSDSNGDDHSSSHHRDEGEERLVLISDPVFCAYIDEMCYIVGQYGSPKDEQSSDRASRKYVSNIHPDEVQQPRSHAENDRHQAVTNDTNISLSRKKGDPPVLSPLVVHLRDTSSPIQF